MGMAWVMRDCPVGNTSLKEKVWHALTSPPLKVILPPKTENPPVSPGQGGGPLQGGASLGAPLSDPTTGFDVRAGVGGSDPQSGSGGDSPCLDSGMAKVRRFRPTITHEKNRPNE